MADFSKTINQLIDLLLTRVRSGTGTTDPLYNQALLDLNLALQELAILHSWKWLRKEVSLAVTAGTRLVNGVASFPTDVINYNDMIAIISGSNIPLTMITEDEANDLYPDLLATGTPKYYIIGPPAISTTVPPKRTIELRPAPNLDITLNVSYTYTFKIYTSAEGAEVPPIPQNYYSPLIELAAARLFTHLKNSRSEIEQAQTKGLLFLKQLAKKDTDKNQGKKAIGLPREMAIYRARRYSL